MMEVGQYDAELARTHWWWRARADKLTRILDAHCDLAPYAVGKDDDGQTLTRPPLLVDAGCGTGTYLRTLSRYGCAVGVDSDFRAILACPDAFDTVCGDLYALDDILDTPADTITALDVLEHLDDDFGALQAFRRALADDGLLVVAVPAFMELWSAHDVRLGHKRRYTRKTLTQLVTQAGFDVVEASYALSFALPVAWVQRRVAAQPSNGTPEGVTLPGWVNAAALGVARLENATAALGIAPPFGTSVWCVARPRTEPRRVFV